MEHTLQTYALECLKKAMKVRGVNQVKISSILGLSKQTTSNYLKGNTAFTLDKFEEFCLAVGVLPTSIIENYENQVDPGHIVNEVQGNYETKATIKIKALEKDVEQMYKNCDLLEQLVEDKKRIIYYLERRLAEYEEPNKQTNRLMYISHKTNRPPRKCTLQNKVCACCPLQLVKRG